MVFMAITIILFPFLQTKIDSQSYLRVNLMLWNRLICGVGLRYIDVIMQNLDYKLR